MQKMCQNVLLAPLSLRLLARARARTEASARSALVVGGWGGAPHARGLPDGVDGGAGLADDTAGEVVAPAGGRSAARSRDRSAGGSAGGSVTRSVGRPVGWLTGRAAERSVGPPAGWTNFRSLRRSVGWGGGGGETEVGRRAREREGGRRGGAR